MCGHVGIIGNSKVGFYKSEVQVFIELLYTDFLRGEDATGVCHVDKDNKVTILKEASPIAEFQGNADYHALIVDAVRDGRILMGHNRKKTVGQNRDEDAHPFVIDNNVVFNHNGTLHAHKHLADVAVDSHALGIHISPHGDDPVKMREALDTVNGAYAVVWYDQKKSKIYFLRNKERPLYYAHLKNGSFAYASEYWMLAGILSRNGHGLDKIEEFKVDTIYSIDIEATKLEMEAKELPAKKSMAHPTKGGQVVKQYGKGTETSTSGSDTISKNAFKKEIRHMQRGPITFWVDEVFPTANGGVTVFGSNENYPGFIFKSHCLATLLWAEEELVGKLAIGTFQTGTYDDKASMGIVWCDKVRYNQRALLGSPKNETTPIVH